MRESILSYNHLPVIYPASRNILLKKHESPRKWRYFKLTVILVYVRQSCRYRLFYRDLKEMMCERDLSVNHTMVWRLVQRYAPAINKRVRPRLKMSGVPYRIEETCVKVGTEWKHLCRMSPAYDGLQ